MERPTTRVLAVLELLQTHAHISGSVLSRRVGVDGRTLRRYITILEELGIPITTDRGRHGGYSLVPGFKLPPMMFTDDEALALSLGLLAARSLGLKDAAPAVASALAKLERVMPANLRRRVRAIDETVSLDVTRPEPARGDNRALAVLSAAAQSGERVHLRYVTAESHASERDIDPYGLAYRGGRWYVVGHCHLRKDLRSFRLDRIEEVRPLDIAFERPPNFDALGYLAFSAATLPRRHTVEVCLHTDLKTAQRELRDTIGVFEPTPEGVVLFAQADDLDWFARQLARAPFDFEVIGPKALREAVSRGGVRLRRLAARTKQPQLLKHTGRERSVDPGFRRDTQAAAVLPTPASSAGGSKAPSKRRRPRGRSRPKAGD